MIEQQAHEGELLPEAADLFGNCHRDFKEDPVIRGFRAALARLSAFRRPGRMLDVGPGTGIFLHLAREAGWEPRGIDVCVEGAQQARTEFDVPVDVGDFETYPYDPESFDCITMLDVLEHTIDPVAFLARARALLAPGGLLYVAVPNQASLLTTLLDPYIRAGGPLGAFFLERLYVLPHVFYFNPRTLAHAATKAGFEIVETRQGNVYLGRYRIGWGQRLPMEIVLRLGLFLGRGAKVHLLARKNAP